MNVLIELTNEHAEALNCVKEVQRLRDHARKARADRQSNVYAQTCAAGGSVNAAMRSIAGHLMRDFHVDL